MDLCGTYLHTISRENTNPLFAGSTPHPSQNGVGRAESPVQRRRPVGPLKQEPDHDEDGNEIVQDKEREQNALAEIRLFVKSSCYLLARNAKTAKETWENLQHTFDSFNVIWFTKYV
ncbi:hypothetical protein Trydic_g7743 [Trypoxylus dichotomus]